MTDEAEQEQVDEVQDEAEVPQPVAYVKAYDLEKVRKSGQTARVTLYGPDTQAYAAGEKGDGGFRPVYTDLFV